MEHKLVGGYTLSTKRFSTVLNKHDSTSDTFRSQLSTRSGLGPKHSQVSQEFHASSKKTGSENRRNTEEDIRMHAAKKSTERSSTAAGQLCVKQRDQQYDRQWVLARGRSKQYLNL